MNTFILIFYQCFSLIEEMHFLKETVSIKQTEERQCIIRKSENDAPLNGVIITIPRKQYQDKTRF